MSASTLFDKLWSAHVVRELDDGWSLLHIDRHLLHDLSGPSALAEVRTRGLAVHQPALVFATPDHLVSSDPDRSNDTSDFGAVMWASLRHDAERSGIRVLEPGSGNQGIVHVVGPEQGIVLPGLSVICGDSHTCTNGALGALAFGVGSSQSAQALATQVLAQERPKDARIRLEGRIGEGVCAKDIALGLIARLGAASGTGSAVEYTGPVVESLDMDSRFTLCNLTVELGAKFGVIAPDEQTIDWVKGRTFAPTGEDWEHTVDAWRGLRSDQGAPFDSDRTFDVTAWAPTVTWGTSPEQAIAIDGLVPDPESADTDQQRSAWASAIDYMGLQPGAPIAGTPVDWVFIGSCANSRISDLRAAASVVEGRQVEPGITAWVVPGSEAVQAEAKAEGLDRIFKEAGFDWRAPGCSMCVAANGDRVPPGARCVSTSNRNFVGRQGPGARTHLASPATAGRGRCDGPARRCEVTLTVEPLRVVTSLAAVLDQPNIDTDVIIRIERMVSTDPVALARWAFEALRFRPDGSPDPTFVLNQAPFDAARILVAGPNFGCGSSHEPAVWAIKGLGIRVIIAPSFGDIFRANCHQNGLLAVILGEEEVRALAELAICGTRITVDLEALRIVSGQHEWSFAIGATQRLSLLEGLDDLDLALRDMAQVGTWEKTDRANRSWAWRPLEFGRHEQVSETPRQSTTERT